MKTTRCQEDLFVKIPPRRVAGQEFPGQVDAALGLVQSPELRKRSRALDVPRRVGRFRLYVYVEVRDRRGEVARAKMEPSGLKPDVGVGRVKRQGSVHRFKPVCQAPVPHQGSGVGVREGGVAGVKGGRGAELVYRGAPVTGGRRLRSQLNVHARKLRSVHFGYQVASVDRHMYRLGVGSNLERLVRRLDGYRLVVCPASEVDGYRERSAERLALLPNEPAHNVGAVSDGRCLILDCIRR